MDSYCDIKFDINNTYLNNNKIKPGDLEKSARLINNNNLSKSKDIYRHHRKNPNNINNDNQATISFLTNKSDPQNCIKPHHQSSDISMSCITDSNTNNVSNGFYSAQGDYLENKYQPSNVTGTLLCDIINDNNCNNKINNKINGKIKKPKTNLSIKRKKTKYEDVSLDTPSFNYNNDSSSDSNSSLSMDSTNSSDSDLSYYPDPGSWNIKEIDKQIKTKSKFNTKKRSKRHKCIDFDLHSVESLESLDSGESLLRHIRFCKECKDKVIDLIRKNKSEQKKVSNNKLINEIRNLDTNHKITKHTSNHTLTSTDIDTFTDTCADNTKAIIKSSKMDKVEKMDTTHYVESYMPELKEIIVVCLIGFLIIMILDLMMRSKS